jgi:type I restriction enzyme S subunit
MSELTDWGQTTLGKHCVICTGKKDVNEGEMSGIYPFFTCSRNHIYSNKYSFDTEALLIAGNGEVGNVEYYKGKFEAYQRTYVLDNFNINIQYIYHLLKYSLKDTLSRSHAGSVIQFIKLEDLTGFTFFYPKDNQEILRIVKILDTIDTAIQQTQAIINKLKQLKQGLLHDLLTRGVGANGELRPCYEDAPHLYKESPLGWIPKEWEVKKLDSISSTVTSGSRDWARFYADTGALFIRIGNLTREHINFRYDSVIYVNPPANGDGQRTKLEAGDILISITADLGIIGVMSDRMGEAYINQHISLVRPVHKDVNSRFIGHYLCTSQAQNYISKLNDGGAKSGLNLPTIRSLEVSLPLSRVEQDCIATQLDNIDNQIQTSKQELEKLKSTKLGVMDDLLTGRIRVTSLLQTEASST